jgi:ribosomal protein S27E
MRELRIKCIDCGSEDFTIHTDHANRRIEVTCDSCGASSNSAKAGEKRDVRQKDIHARVYETTQKGRVYFVSSDQANAPVKIGYTTTGTKTRIGSLQTGNPHKLRSLAEIEGKQQLESALHKIFSGQKLTGEWFARSPELEALIEALSD